MKQSTDLLVDSDTVITGEIITVYPCGECGAEWRSFTAAELCCRD